MVDCPSSWEIQEVGRFHLKQTGTEAKRSSRASKTTEKPVYNQIHSHQSPKRSMSEGLKEDVKTKEYNQVWGFLFVFNISLVLK